MRSLGIRLLTSTITALRGSAAGQTAQEECVCFLRPPRPSGIGPDQPTSEHPILSVPERRSRDRIPSGQTAGRPALHGQADFVVLVCVSTDKTGVLLSILVDLSAV